MEVKGVTLEEKGVALFPDAPTERGIKHIQELEQAVLEGYEAYIFFIIQMKGIKYFSPNYPVSYTHLRIYYRLMLRLILAIVVVLYLTLTEK